MKTSDAGLAAIMQREGKVNHAYPDPAWGWKVPTIGVGHTGPEVHPGLVWTDEQVMDALRSDIVQREDAINAQNLALTQNQFDALVSFVFNVGVGAFRGSTMLRILHEEETGQAGPKPDVSAQFPRWNIPAEIIERRAGERQQFDTP